MVGLLLWTASNLLRMLTEPANLSFGPVLIDSAHLAGYLAVLAGILVYPHRARRSFTPLRQILELAISSAATITLGWQLMVQPILNSTAVRRSAIFWRATYPLADLVLLVVLLDIILLTEPGRLDNAFKWVGFGLAALTISDLAYSLWILQNPYQVGGLIDLGWATGYFAFGLSALASLVPAKDTSNLAPPGSIARFLRNLEERLQTSLPLVATFVLGWYTVLSWQIRQRMDLFGLVMSILLVLALVARQGVAAGEMELQQYAMLVNSIAEPAFICNRNGLLRLVNPAMLASLGRQSSNEDLHNQPVLNLFDAPSLPADLLPIALAQGWSGEVRLVRQDGHTLPVYLSLRPIPRFFGERLALAGTAHDLTVQKNQQAALQAAYEQIAFAHHQLETLNEQLEAKVNEKTYSLSQAYAQLEQQNLALQKLDELKSDFVSLVSHELRAPLTNISGGIELVLNRAARLPESVNQSLVLVQAEIHRLTHFVESILDLSALEAGRAPLYPTPVRLIDSIVPLQSQLVAVPDVQRVQWQIPTDLPLVLADDRALTSIIFHLIDNAVKYAPTGDITVRAWSDAAWVCVQVTDQGQGIPPDALPLIFDKFYRFHYGDAQLVYGHGLGLYIVKQLLQAMNGSIQAENLNGGGASFTFRLPVIED